MRRDGAVGVGGGEPHSGNSECSLPIKYPSLHIWYFFFFLLNIGGDKLYNDIAFKNTIYKRVKLKLIFTYY